jgi:ComF family protein
MGGADMNSLDGAAGAVWKPHLARLRAPGRALLDLILPPRALDHGAATQTPGLSAEAWQRIHFLEAPVCDGCGAPFEHDLGEGVRCAACTSQPRVFSRARAACLYDDASRDLVLQLKHADRTELAGLLTTWMSRAAAELIEDAELVTPVPMRWRRLVKRRYNQAAELARPLARRWKKPYAPQVLQRTKGDSQAGKSAAGRRRAVAGAFQVPERQKKTVQGRRVLLVDDVLTTGATAEACARALLRAGARAVDVAVIARVRDVAWRES